MSPIVKIGVARKPNYRLSDMQTGNSRPLALMYLHETVGRAEAHRIEFSVHEEFNERRIRGEWFSISVEEAEKAIKSASVSCR